MRVCVEVRIEAGVWVESRLWGGPLGARAAVELVRLHELGGDEARIMLPIRFGNAEHRDRQWARCFEVRGARGHGLLEHVAYTRQEAARFIQSLGEGCGVSGLGVRERWRCYACEALATGTTDRRPQGGEFLPHRLGRLWGPQLEPGCPRHAQPGTSFVGYEPSAAELEGAVGARLWKDEL